MNKKSRNVYMIGIKGVGMTTLAQFFMARGHKVSGSDIAETFMTDKTLKKLKIQVKSPFDKNNIPQDADLIVHSIAYTPENNVEMKALKDLNNKAFRILSYSEALGEVFSAGKGIAVCGSHGKTTTTAWLGYLLWKSGKKPNVLVGSSVSQFKGSGLQSSSKLFVAEADEYGNKLKYLNPYGIVLNNIDYDHPDFFKTEKDYVKVFSDFIKRLPKDGFLIINNEDKDSKKIAKFCHGRVATYAIDDEKYDGVTVNYLAREIKAHNGIQSFLVNNLGEFKIKLWGRHNIQNALAVIAVARELGVSLPNIKKHLFTFKGTERRAQILGKYKGAIIIDDYAHHPTEIRTTLDGVKAHYPQKKIKLVFHPHTFTRTKALFNDFAESFVSCDELIVLDIYGSAREQQGGTSSRELVKAIKKFNNQNRAKQKISNLKDIDSVVTYLTDNVTKDEILLLMGAGDVFRVGEKLLATSKKKK